jgi:hypothetical protein
MLLAFVVCGVSARVHVCACVCVCACLRVRVCGCACRPLSAHHNSCPIGNNDKQVRSQLLFHLHFRGRARAVPRQVLAGVRTDESPREMPNAPSQVPRSSSRSTTSCSGCAILSAGTIQDRTVCVLSSFAACEESKCCAVRPAYFPAASSSYPQRAALSGRARAYAPRTNTLCVVRAVASETNMARRPKSGQCVAASRRAHRVMCDRVCSERRTTSYCLGHKLRLRHR